MMKITISGRNEICIVINAKNRVIKAINALKEKDKQVQIMQVIVYLIKHDRFIFHFINYKFKIT